MLPLILFTGTFLLSKLSQHTLFKDCINNDKHPDKIFLCKNKCADQLRGIRDIDEHLCFRHIVRILNLNLNPLTTFCGCTARFVSYMIGNSEDLFLMTRLIRINVATRSFPFYIHLVVPISRSSQTFLQVDYSTESKDILNKDVSSLFLKI